MTRNKDRTPVRESPFWRAYDHRRYAVLFYALLVTLLVIPVTKTIGMPALLVKLLLGGCLVVAVMPSASRRTRDVLFWATLLLIFAGIISAQDSVPVNAGFALALIGIAGLAAAAGVLRFIVKSNAVNSETIYAALSTYLLGGIFFGQIYWSIELLYPGSLTGPDPVSEAVAIYYSFVTLATLGYGDFLPRSDIMRGIATFEVIGGQLYLVVMVARLVGAFGDAKEAPKPPL
jgi:hypothetical protein